MSTSYMCYLIIVTVIAHAAIVGLFWWAMPKGGDK